MASLSRCRSTEVETMNRTATGRIKAASGVAGRTTRAKDCEAHKNRHRQRRVAAIAGDNARAQISSSKIAAKKTLNKQTAAAASLLSRFGIMNGTGCSGDFNILIQTPSPCAQRARLKQSNHGTAVVQCYLLIIMCIIHLFCTRL